MCICNCIQFRLQIHNAVDYVPYFLRYIKLLKPQLSTCHWIIVIILGIVWGYDLDPNPEIRNQSVSVPNLSLGKIIVMFRKLARRATMTPYEATQSWDLT
jgi:hypothetical protein